MKIDYTNFRFLDSIYIHDSDYTGFSYSYDERKVGLLCNNHFSGKQLQFSFNNVVTLQVQGCAFWGDGANSILWLNVERECKNPNALLEIERKRRPIQDLECSFLDPNKEIEYISIVFTINSGDTLEIVCQSVDFEETPID